MLRSTATKGFIWSAIDSFSSQLINFIIGVILARLLTPEDFGLIGMITIFLAVSQIFVNSGINDALIRKKDVEEIYYNTAFIFNIAVSGFLYVILYFSAGYIAAFYEEPELVSIIRVIAVTLLFNGFILVQKVQITKKIDFKALAKVGFLASLISGAIGIALAFQNYGVWSLVWRNVLLSLLTLILFSLISKWRPTFKFSRTAFKDLFGFGSRLMILGIIDTVYQNIYFLIIGKYFSAAQLGQYTRAETFKRLPAQGITQIVQRVSYPLLAGIQDDLQRLRNSYSRLLKSTMLISISGLFILAAIAQDLTIVLLGAEWQEAGVYLQILCFSAVFYPLDALNSNILKVMNRSDLILKVGIWRKILAIPVILILIFVGIIPFLFALIAHQIISFLLISNYSKKFINYGTVDQIKEILPVLIIMTVISTILFSIALNWTVSPLIRLLTIMIGGVCLSWLVFELLKIEAYTYLKHMLKEKIKK